MANFIDYLVQKGAGLPLMNAPETPSIPRFESLSNPLISGNEKLKGEIIEGKPVTSIEEFQEPVKFSDEKMPGFAVPSREGLQKPTEIMKDTLEVSMTLNEKTLAATSSVLPTTGITSLNQVDSTISGSVKESASSENQISELGVLKQDSPSIALRPDAQVKQESLSRATEDRGKIADARKAILDQPHPLASSPAQDASKRITADHVYVATVEPVTEAPRGVSIKELMVMKRDGASKQQSIRGSTKTTKTQQNKEVRVNIGRVELKTSQQASPQPNPPVRGFDDYLMMRVYLDRHYF